MSSVGTAMHIVLHAWRMSYVVISYNFIAAVEWRALGVDLCMLIFIELE